MKKVLVLDDELDVDFIFKTMLEDEIQAKKLTIDYFSNPKTCLEEFASNPNKYDYVLTDINMPIMNGVKFAEEIRKLNYRGPIAFISAYFKHDFEKDMARLNIQHFIPKPINFELIKKILAIK